MLAAPHLERLSAETGEGSKVSIADAGGVLVVAAVQGTREYALTVVPGQRLPPHAGGASKVLMAHMEKPALAALLTHPLARYTRRTIADRTAWPPSSPGSGVGAGRRTMASRAEHPRFCRPIPDRTGRVIAALSVPFLAGARRRTWRRCGPGDRGRRRDRRRAAPPRRG